MENKIDTKCLLFGSDRQKPASSECSLVSVCGSWSDNVTPQWDTMGEHVFGQREREREGNNNNHNVYASNKERLTKPSLKMW